MKDMDYRVIIAGCRDFNEYALLRERHERQTHGQTHWCFFGNGGTLKEGVRHIDNKGENTSP